MLQEDAFAVLKKVFSPKSVVIVGASDDPAKLGYKVLTNLKRDYKGSIYPVNPRADQILGLKTYRSVNEISDRVDLAVLLVPGAAVAQVLNDCAAKGVGAAIVMTSGFAETGETGIRKQEELKRIARSGPRVVGPNCIGLLSNHSGVNLIFGAVKPMPGSIAIISQSGALGTNAFFRWASERNIGISTFVSTGNEADLCSADYLGYLGRDPETRVIMMYMEGVKEGRRFLSVAEEVTRTKPVVLLKGGETKRGAEAASSHTGALAGSDEIFDAACRQVRITRVNDVDELFDVAVTFDCQPIPKGNCVGLIAGLGGGMGVVAADACMRFGLEVPRLSSDTMAKLKKIVPAYSSVNNPVDLASGLDPTQAVECAGIVLRDENIHSIIYVGFGSSLLQQDSLLRGGSSLEDDAVNSFLDLRRQLKPILVVSPASKHEFESLRRLEAGRIPVFLTPRKAAYALSRLVIYGKRNGIN